MAIGGRSGLGAVAGRRISSDQRRHHAVSEYETSAIPADLMPAQAAPLLRSSSGVVVQYTTGRFTTACLRRIASVERMFLSSRRLGIVSQIIDPGMKLQLAEKS